MTMMVICAASSKKIDAIKCPHLRSLSALIWSAKSDILRGSCNQLSTHIESSLGCVDCTALCTLPPTHISNCMPHTASHCLSLFLTTSHCLSLHTSHFLPHTPSHFLPHTAPGCLKLHASHCLPLHALAPNKSVCLVSSLGSSRG